MTRLADVVELTFGFAFKSAEFSESPDDVRLLRGDNVAQGNLRWGGAKRFPAARVDEVDRYLLSVGDVVIAMDRPWIDAGLKYAVVREQDVPSLLVQRVARLQTKSDLLDQGFLSAVIGSTAFTNYVIGVQTGSAIPHISGGQIGDFKFTLPTVEEQRAIAATLGALDDKIESNRRKSEIVWQLASSKWQALIAGGDKAPLGSILQLAYGRALPSRVRLPGSVPVYGSSGVTGWHNQALVGGPAVIIGRKGTVGSVHWEGADSFPIDTTFIVEPANGWPLIACYFAALGAGLSEMNSDSAVPGLNRDRALSVQVRLPELADAQNWAADIMPLIELASSVSSENEELAQLRDSLLPALLSGRVAAERGSSE